MAAVYCVVLVVLLPVLIWELYREHAEDSFKAWFVAGIFVLLTIPIFLAGLVQHLLNYTQPHLQKHIIRWGRHTGAACMGWLTSSLPPSLNAGFCGWCPSTPLTV